MECIILVGGLGLRLRNEVPELPKPLAPISGQAFLGFLIKYWKKQGITHFILAAGYKSQHITDYIQKYWPNESIDISIEKEPLGTGGGFLKASQFLNTTDPFLLINGDTYFPLVLKNLIDAQKKNDSDILITLSKKENSEQQYMKVKFDNLNNITFFSHSSQTSPWVNGGSYLLHPRVLKIWKKYIAKKISLEDDLIPEIIASPTQKAHAYPAKDINFIDIGTPEDYNKAQCLITED